MNPQLNHSLRAMAELRLTARHAPTSSIPVEERRKLAEALLIRAFRAARDLGALPGPVPHIQMSIEKSDLVLSDLLEDLSLLQVDLLGTVHSVGFTNIFTRAVNETLDAHILHHNHLHFQQLLDDLDNPFQAVGQD